MDLVVSIVCKKYEELELCRSAANFLPGVEMEGDLPGRMEVEVDALMAVETDLYFNSNVSNKCQCPPPMVQSTTAVDNANVGKDFVVVDILAVDDNTHVEEPSTAVNHDQADNVNAPTAVDDPVDEDQVKEELSIEPTRISIYCLLWQQLLHPDNNLESCFTMSFVFDAQYSIADIASSSPLQDWLHGNT